MSSGTFHISVAGMNLTCAKNIALEPLSSGENHAADVKGR